MKVSTLSITLVVILSAASELFAASFDCQKATSRVEKLICATPELSALDETLGVAYKAALETAPDAEAFRQTGRTWIRTVRDVCEDAPCMIAAYERRISELKALTTSTSSDADDVIEYDEPLPGSTRADPEEEESEELAEAQQMVFWACDRGFIDDCMKFSNILLKNGKVEPAHIGFESACTQGDGLGCYKAGELSNQLQKVDEARNFYVKSCKLGHDAGCKESTALPKLPSMESGEQPVHEVPVADPLPVAISVSSLFDSGKQPPNPVLLAGKITKLEIKRNIFDESKIISALLEIGDGSRTVGVTPDDYQELSKLSLKLGDTIAVHGKCVFLPGQHARISGRIYSTGFTVAPEEASPNTASHAGQDDGVLTVERYFGERLRIGENRIIRIDGELLERSQSADGKIHLRLGDRDNVINAYSSDRFDIKGNMERLLALKPGHRVELIGKFFAETGPIVGFEFTDFSSRS